MAALVKTPPSRTAQAVAVLLTAALLASGCASGAAEVGSGQPPASGTCGPVRNPPLQAGAHLLGDTRPPKPYSSIPPTSGWHASGPVRLGAHPPGQPLSEPEQVNVLEAGGVVVTYHDLDERDHQRLLGLVGDRYADRVAATSYERIPAGTVAMTGWGVLQRCEGLDLVAVEDFIATYADAEVGGH